MNFEAEVHNNWQDITARSDDGSVTAEDPIVKVFQLMLEAGDKMGRMGTPGKHLKQWMIDAGYQNVHEHVVKVPAGPWPKDKKLV